MGKIANTLPAGFEAEIKKAFPDGFWVTTPSELEAYGRDWTRIHDPAPAAIAFPLSWGRLIEGDSRFSIRERR